MKKYLFAAVVILLFCRAFNAQTSEPTVLPSPSTSPSTSPTPDNGLTDKDKASIESFTVNVKSAELICEDDSKVKRLKVVFDQTLAEIYRVSTIIGDSKFSDRYQDAAAYHLMNLTTGAQWRLIPPTDKTAYELNFMAFDLEKPKEFDIEQKYSLLMRGLKLEKSKATENASITSLEVSSSCEVMPKTLAKAAEIADKSPPSVYDYIKKNFEADKDTPQVKISFGMNGERVTSPFYSTVIVAEPFEKKRLGLHGAYSLVPIFLNLEKNDATGSEIDKLRIGSKFRHYVVFGDDGKYTTNEPTTSRFIGIRSELTAQLETTTKFKTGNGILGLKTGFPISLYQTRSHSMRLTPFVGFDGGYKVLDGESTTKERWIARPSFGAEFYWTPGRTEKEIPYQFDVSYIQRIFLQPETIYTRDANRDIIVEGISTNPKGYFTAQFTLWQSRFISPIVRYTYGRDTPQYLLENHKYVLGIQANFDWLHK